MSTRWIKFASGYACTHFASGLGYVESGVRFRPYTSDEHRVLAMNGSLSAEQCYRVEQSMSEPGDVVLDLGSAKLNKKLRDLLDEALEGNRK